MGRSRMFDDDVPRHDDEPVPPRTTIVGGRPPEKQGEAPPVPTGIQRLLRLAAIDEAFRAQLLEKRDGVAAAAGVELTATERSVLRAASDAQLDAMARHLPAPESARREFFRQTAATAAALLAGPVLLACESCTAVKGSRPDVPPPPPPAPPEPSATPAPTDGFAEPPPPRPEQNPMQTEGGAAPDEPPPEPPPPYPAPTGIKPDVPPKKR